MPENVQQCKGCGWLAVRLKRTRELVEADEVFRENAYVAETGVGTGSEFIYHRTPVCFADKRNFYQELRAPDASDSKVLAAIGTKPDDCYAYTNYKPGYSPRDLQDMKALEEQRKWQAEQAALADTRHQDNLRVVAEATRWNWWAILLAAAIGAAATLGAVRLASPAESSPTKPVPNF